MLQGRKTWPWIDTGQIAFVVAPFPEDSDQCVTELQFSFFSSAASTRNSLRRASALDFW
ncbi:hypothetical protein SAMN05216420_10348 [Nitrosospira sp. Nl5]|nr:hypothetical protein SAMN05216420_10348 [Nitrosospira sp. Nl5]